MERNSVQCKVCDKPMKANGYGMHASCARRLEWAKGEVLKRHGGRLPCYGPEGLSLERQLVVSATAAAQPHPYRAKERRGLDYSKKYGKYYL